MREAKGFLNSVFSFSERYRFLSRVVVINLKLVLNLLQFEVLAKNTDRYIIILYWCTRVF